jgi:hypothetical protein
VIERQIMALPVKYGGLGIPIFVELARKDYSTSLIVTQPLVNTMTSQCSINAPGRAKEGSRSADKRLSGSPENVNRSVRQEINPDNRTIVREREFKLVVDPSS